MKCSHKNIEVVEEPRTCRCKDCGLTFECGTETMIDIKPVERCLHMSLIEAEVQIALIGRAYIVGDCVQCCTRVVHEIDRGLWEKHGVVRPIVRA